MKAYEKLCPDCNRPVPIGEQEWHETMECRARLRERKPSAPGPGNQSTEGGEHD